MMPCREELESGVISVVSKPVVQTFPLSWKAMCNFLLLGLRFTGLLLSATVGQPPSFHETMF